MTLFFFQPFLLGCPSGKAQSKNRGRLARAGKSKTKRRTDQVSRPPSAALLLNVFLFERKWWVITDENGSGKGTKIIFLSEVISPILSPKKLEKLIA